jgi:hypothetical protein
VQESDSGTPCGVPFVLRSLDPGVRAAREPLATLCSAFGAEPPTARRGPKVNAYDIGVQRISRYPVRLPTPGADRDVFAEADLGGEGAGDLERVEEPLHLCRE